MFWSNPARVASSRQYPAALASVQLYPASLASLQLYPASLASLYDSWSGTEGDLHWSSGTTHRNALKAHGAEYGRQYIVCRYQKAYPQYILRYQMGR